MIIEMLLWSPIARAASPSGVLLPAPLLSLWFRKNSYGRNDDGRSRAAHQANSNIAAAAAASPLNAALACGGCEKLILNIFHPPNLRPPSYSSPLAPRACPHENGV